MSLERPKCCLQEAEPGGTEAPLMASGTGGHYVHDTIGEGGGAVLFLLAGRLWGREADDPAQGAEPITTPGLRGSSASLPAEKSREARTPNTRPQGKGLFHTKESSQLTTIWKRQVLTQGDLAHQ